MRGYDEDKMRAAARELIELAAAGHRNSALNKPLELLVPAISVQVERAYYRKKTRYIDLEDLVQNVLVKIRKTPPGNPKQEDPLLTVLAWVKTVAHRELFNAWKQETTIGPDEGRVPRAVSFDQTNTGKEDRVPNQRLEAKIVEESHHVSSGSVDQYVEWEHWTHAGSLALEHLRKDYPLGAKYFEIKLANDELSQAEIAELMGKTRAYIHQIRRRTLLSLKKIVGALSDLARAGSPKR